MTHFRASIDSPIRPWYDNHKNAMGIYLNPGNRGFVPAIPGVLGSLWQRRCWRPITAGAALMHYFLMGLKYRSISGYSLFWYEESGALAAGYFPEDANSFDEWDCVFRERKEDSEAQKRYLDFLRNPLKDNEFVGLAYMAGILTIKKYGSHSALNMFDEFSMTDLRMLAEFVGFTEPEVQRKYF